MAIRTGKEKLSLPEIKNILKSNLTLYMSIYKNQPDFLDYFIDLTLYLLRYKYDRADEFFQEKPSKAAKMPKPEGRILISGLESIKRSEKVEYCSICGGEMRGQHRCPFCGNVIL